MYFYHSSTIIILSVQFCLTLSAEQCVKNSHCSCNTEKLGEVSLVGIAGELGYLETNFGEKNKFRVFPCGIEKDWGERCNKQEDPAFCQYINTQSTTINLGRLGSMQVQSFTEFVTVFNYTGGSSLGSTNRSSEIALVCNPNVTTPVFKFIEEVNLGHYKFELTSNRVCPGLIDEGCQRIDSCTCKLDNEKGIVTVHKLLENMNKVGFDITDKGKFYSLFPCPIKANSSVYEYCDRVTGDPAGCMRTPDAEKFTLGLQSQLKFKVSQTEPFTTVVIYRGGSTISDTQIKTTLVLECGGAKSGTKVEFLGNNPLLDYNFRITDPKLCPHW